MTPQCQVGPDQSNRLCAHVTGPALNSWPRNKSFRALRSSSTEINQFPRGQKEGREQVVAGGGTSVGDAETSLKTNPGLPGSSAHHPHGPALSSVQGVTMAHPVTRSPLRFL